MFDLLSSLPRTRAVLAEGQHVFHRGDRVKAMILVETGCVHLIRYQARGASLILQRATAGAVLAEASLFVSAYHCDAIARTTSNILMVRRSDVQKLFQTSAHFAQAWVTHLATEMRSARRRAEILSLRTIAERLDAWISEFGALPERGGWKDLAQEIGASPEALYREIAKRRRSA